MNDIQTQVIEIIADIAGCAVSDVKVESRLQEDLDLDSLDRLEIMMDLEKEFSFTCPDDEYAKLNTTQDIIDVVDRLAKK